MLQFVWSYDAQNPKVNPSTISVVRTGDSSMTISWESPLEGKTWYYFLYAKWWAEYDG
jgi:hypothetical protein